MNNQHKICRYRILLCYKNFSKDCSVSHIGLGVTACYTAKTLCAHGFFAEARPIFNCEDLRKFIESQENGPRPVTHVIFMAQFVPTRDISTMVRSFPHITFALNCHSNAGFLQAEPPAISLIREAIDLEVGVSNFHACCNNERFAEGLSKSFGRPVQWLPNLYYMHGSEPIHRPLWNGGTLRIGMFGSLRVYKNFTTAAFAAIALANQLKCHAEIWINAGRTDGSGNNVHNSILAVTKNLPNIQLKNLQWASWPEFKRVVGSMNILFQPSYTETFNNVTADGVCEGVPSVVSSAIEWCPDSWIANPDSLSDIECVARRLLTDPHAAQEGYRALKHYVTRGLVIWKSFLSRPQPMPYLPGDPGWAFFPGDPH